MSNISDLQPKSFKVKIRDNEYNCKPLRMAHRLIIAKIQPFFEQLENLTLGKDVELSGKQILELEAELDALIQNLIPELGNITLDIEDISSILNQIMDSIMPDESKKLKEANVEVGKKKEIVEKK